MEENKEEIIEEVKEEVKKESKPKKASKKDEIMMLNELLGQEKEKSMRIQAEMMNFKKRTEEKVQNMYKYANEDILKKLLLTIDNFERALQYENEENTEIFKGFYMIYTNILNILKDNEVVEIEALNAEFDPNIHQAVLTDHVDGVEANIVIEVLQKGYMYKDKVLRPAMVKVSD